MNCTNDVHWLFVKMKIYQINKSIPANHINASISCLNSLGFKALRKWTLMLLTCWSFQGAVNSWVNWFTSNLGHASAKRVTNALIFIWYLEIASHSKLVGLDWDTNLPKRTHAITRKHAAANINNFQRTFLKKHRTHRYRSESTY